MPVWLRAALFVLVVPGSVAGWIPWAIARSRAGTAGPLAARHWVGAAVLAAGWTLLLWTTRDFVRTGRGTPAPFDPPRQLVTGGLYSVSRNPMYVGVLLAILGQATWWWSLPALVYAACVAIGFHLRVLLYEEPVLQREFGDAYASYRARVGRWLPRLKWREPA